MINPLISVLNEKEKLPKIILVAPDKDLFSFLHNQSFNTALVMGSTLHYIIKQMDMFIERRKQDLESKKPGALPLADWPKLIWVRMLKRPPVQMPTKAKDAFTLRGKFNSILEERLLDGNSASRHIISIEVPIDGFDLTGELNSIGKEHFWQEIDKGLRRFNLNEITLRPRNFQYQEQSVPNVQKAKDQPMKKKVKEKGMNAANRLIKSVVMPIHNYNQRTLLVPPLKHRSDRSRTRSRSPSKSRRHHENRRKRSHSRSPYRSSRDHDRSYKHSKHYH